MGAGNESFLKSFVFNPATYTGTLDFSSATIQNVYDGAPSHTLAGYQDAIWSTNGTVMIGWHDYNGTGAATNTLNLFELSATVILSGARSSTAAGMSMAGMNIQ